MEDLVKNAWHGRKVFVTGHTGFKGGWLALWLARMGARVRGYSLDPPTRPCFFEAARIGSDVEDLRGDLRDATSLDRAMREFGPEAVFHLGAQPLVRHSYADPVGTYATNVIGTANVLESIRTLRSVRAAVIVTTDKCYLNREWHWSYRETDPLGGHDPYSSSKACVEILTASYRNSFFRPEMLATHGVGLATARAGNVIGGGDWSEDRLVPDLVRGFMAKESVLIRYPQAIRPWQHVLEPIAGYLALGERLFAGEARFADSWNFGPWDRDTWSVGRVATEMVRHWGDGAHWHSDDSRSSHEAQFLKLDSSKARAELHWLPRLDLTTTLEWLVDWYQSWRNGLDMRTFSHNQVSSYEALLQSSETQSDCIKKSTSPLETRM
ncbi:CDP-glucose 4,6-dehydratase [Tunturiibacter gelidiferens]|uniref:CDP-glucose 4,6-dehydratase n=1 Tax=Tunturiibacter gelidiferens TaxID=3069689 RepID=A0AAU7YZW5_9BACT